MAGEPVKLKDLLDRIKDVEQNIEYLQELIDSLTSSQKDTRTSREAKEYSDAIEILRGEIEEATERLYQMKLSVKDIVSTELTVLDGWFYYFRCRLDQLWKTEEKQGGDLARTEKDEKDEPALIGGGGEIEEQRKQCKKVDSGSNPFDTEMKKSSLGHLEQKGMDDDEDELSKEELEEKLLKLLRQCLKCEPNKSLIKEVQSSSSIGKGMPVSLSASAETSSPANLEKEGSSSANEVDSLIRELQETLYNLLNKKTQCKPKTGLKPEKDKVMKLAWENIKGKKNIDFGINTTLKENMAAITEKFKESFKKGEVGKKNKGPETQKDQAVNMATELSHLLIDLVFLNSNSVEVMWKFMNLRFCLGSLDIGQNYVIVPKIAFVLIMTDLEVKKLAQSKKLEPINKNIQNRETESDLGALRDESKVDELILKFVRETLRLELIVNHQEQLESELQEIKSTVEKWKELSGVGIAGQEEQKFQETWRVAAELKRRITEMLNRMKSDAAISRLSAAKSKKGKHRARK